MSFRPIISVKVNIILAITQIIIKIIINVIINVIMWRKLRIVVIGMLIFGP